MEFLGAYPDFSAESELRAIGETGAGVVIHGGGIHLVQEPLGRLAILRHDGFRVS